MTVAAGVQNAGRATANVAKHATTGMFQIFVYLQLLDLPFRRDHPDVVTQETNIEMFQPWSLDTKPKTISNGFFEISDQPSGTGSHAQFVYSYESLKDRVEVNELARYNQEIDHAKESIGYTLTYQTPEQLKKARKPSTFNWAVGVAGLCIFGAASLIAYRYFRDYRLAALVPPPLDAPANLNGIGGWLILLAIVQVLRPFTYLWGMCVVLPKIITTGSWRALTDPIEPTFNPWWAPTLLFEFLFSIVCFIFCTLLIVLFFTKRAGWPGWFVGLLIVGIAGDVVDYALLRQVPGAAPSIYWFTVSMVVLGLTAAIWIPYVVLSKRVKATFRY
jgi:hypothetical protein